MYTSINMQCHSHSLCDIYRWLPENVKLFFDRYVGFAVVDDRTVHNLSWRGFDPYGLPNPALFNAFPRERIKKPSPETSRSIAWFVKTFQPWRSWLVRSGWPTLIMRVTTSPTIGASAMMTSVDRCEAEPLTVLMSSAWITVLGFNARFATHHWALACTSIWINLFRPSQRALMLRLPPRR